MKTTIPLLAALLLALSLSACGDSSAQNDESAGGDSMQSDTAGDAMAEESGGSMQDSVGSSSENEDLPKAAIAVLHSTAGNDASATIRFTPKDGGLAYTTEAEGLEPGEHGYHIHLYGDCSADDGKSAGTHYNLEGSSLNPPEDIDRITGDLGNLDAGDDGSAQHEGMLDGASLTGAKSIVGRGVIIHEKANDPSQPPIGAAGSRQACGVIGITEAQSS